MARLKHQLYLGLRSILRGNRYSANGVTIDVPPVVDAEIRYLLARGRPYEEEEARFIADHLATGMNVIELGGSIGLVSAMIRKKIGPDAQLTIVEALPHLAEIGLLNASRGAERHTDMINAAIDYSGNETVTFSTGHNAHTGHVARDGETEGVTVPTTQLSKVAEDMPAGSFALVCDIEGAEAAMVAAEADVLKRVSVLVLETHPFAYPNGEADRDAMIATLEGLGLRELARENDVICMARPDA